MDNTIAQALHVGTAPPSHRQLPIVLKDKHPAWRRSEPMPFSLLLKKYGKAVSFQQVIDMQYFHPLDFYAEQPIGLI
ncbi:MAG: hypothetical protein CCU26_09835 [Nitrospira sp. UW-LDO-01]|nr:MAG: hypothetical protein CCU26_09835 [Nitrospira sp. UW-LDO-01]